MKDVPLPSNLSMTSMFPSKFYLETSLKSSGQPLGHLDYDWVFCFLWQAAKGSRATQPRLQLLCNKLIRSMRRGPVHNTGSLPQLRLSVTSPTRIHWTNRANIQRKTSATALCTVEKSVFNQDSGRSLARLLAKTDAAVHLPSLRCSPNGQTALLSRHQRTGLCNSTLLARMQPAPPLLQKHSMHYILLARRGNTCSKKNWKLHLQALRSSGWPNSLHAEIVHEPFWMVLSVLFCGLCNTFLQTPDLTLPWPFLTSPRSTAIASVACCPQ